MRVLLTSREGEADRCFSADVNVIAVSEQARGKGVGAAMIDAIKEHAARLSSPDDAPMAVHLDAVEDAVPFYKKQDFEIHDALHDPNWGFRLFPALWSGVTG